MSTEGESKIEVQSTRFGDITVNADCIIEFPSGLVGFGRARRFILIEHRPPFSWLQCVEDPNLAFVVVDGSEFGANYSVPLPIGDKDCDLKDSDEFGILVIVTVRPSPVDTTANLKAPLVVNLRNKKGVQMILDNPGYSVRFPLWVEDKTPVGGSEEKK